MANLKVGNNSIGKISLIRPYDNLFDGPPFEDSPDRGQPWVRPSEWLDMPNIASGDNKAAMLLFMYSGVPLEPAVRLRAKSVFPSYPTYSTIDWGDGYTSVASGNSNSPNTLYISNHTYKYEDLPEDSEFTYNGQTARQALIQIDNSASGCEVLDLNHLTVNTTSMGGTHDNNAAGNFNANNLLDLHVASQDENYLQILLAVDYNSERRHNLQRVVIEGNSTFGNSHSQFAFLPSLKFLSYPSGAWRSQGDLRNFFNGCRELEEIPSTEFSNSNNCHATFTDCKKIKNVDNVIFGNNITIGSHFFSNCSSLEEVPTHIDYSSMTTAQSIFSSCFSLKTVPSGLKFSSNLTNIRGLFANCHNLVEIPNDFFDLFANSVTNTYFPFSECYKLKSIPRIHFPNSTIMSRFALNCASLEEIRLGDLSSVYDSNVNNARFSQFGSAFQGCTSLKKVTVDFPENFISNSWHGTFTNCLSLEEIPYINTASGYELSYMFHNCKSAKKTQGAFDLSSAYNTNRMFGACSKLKRIEFKNINSKLNDAESMFDSCINLEEFPSGFFQDFNSCPTKTHSMFSNTIIPTLPDVNLSGVNTAGSRGGTFRYMKNLRSVGNITFGSGTVHNELFRDCHSLKYIGYADASLVGNMTNAFYNCASLEWCDISGIPVSTSFYNNFLGSGAIENIFHNLASGVTGQTINISQNYGASELHSDTLNIAYSKGWTVTT